MSTFRVGQKVVCVIAKPVPTQSLTKGSVYTIIGVHSCPHGTACLNVGKDTSIGGSGYTRLHCGCRVFGRWHGADRFRPLIEDLTTSLAQKESERLVEERPDHFNEPEHA